MSRRGRILVAILAAIVLPSAQAAAQSPAETLSLRYSPVLRLVAQTEPCEHGEAYIPTDVNLVLPNAEVALRGPWDTTNIIKVAPTAADLAPGLFGYHLDFPGHAVAPGCASATASTRVPRARTGASRS